MAEGRDLQEDTRLTGGREEERVKLFVNQVPKHMTEEQLIALFQEVTIVDEVNIIRDKVTKASRGCCFLICPSREEADKVIMAYHNKRTLPGASSPLEVKHAAGELERLDCAFLESETKDQAQATKCGTNDIQPPFFDDLPMEYMPPYSGDSYHNYGLMQYPILMQNQDTCTSVFPPVNQGNSLHGTCPDAMQSTGYFFPVSEIQHPFLQFSSSDQHPYLPLGSWQVSGSNSPLIVDSNSVVSKLGIQTEAMSLGRKKVPIWTSDENTLFKMELEKYGKETPDRWHNIARMKMGGNKSAEKVKRQYYIEDNAGKFSGKDAPFIAYRQKEMKSYKQSGEAAALPNCAFSFIGRENDKESIIELLMHRDAEECNSCCVVSIIGELGGGKTTLARAVYNDSRVLDTFDIRIFVSMSESYDEKQLMKAIIEAITQTSCEMAESDMLETTINEELSGKRFLIVLDDATYENKCSLNVLSLLNIATSENTGSSVLITTSSIAIANDVMGAKKVYNLNPLSESCCFEIIKSIAFERKDPNDVDYFVWISKMLVTRSGHNPLCLKVLGGLLKKLNPEKWIEVLESDFWRKNKFDGDIFPALRVCYDYLPTHLKRCFSYFSLFPKNYVFKKDEVIRLWLSQGFIEPKEGRETEDIGDEYFDELFGRLFIEELSNDSGGEKFVMHRQIHDLAKHVSINEYLSSEDYMQRIPENIRHFSFVPSEFQNLPIKHMVAEATDLQSFLVLNRCSWNPISPIANLVDLSDLVLKFRNLKTLNLSNTAIEFLPNAVGLLGNLLYLGLNNTGIKSLPPKISCLTNLQTLEAAKCYLLCELPGSIKELTNLRHLDVRKEGEHVRMPVGIGSLCNLRSLPAFNVGSDLSESAIGELKSLELLRGSLQISGLENVASALDAKVANLVGKLYLEKLSLQWSPSIDYIMEENCEDVVEMVLENLQPCYNLHELVIRNYMGSKFPAWMEDVLYAKLESVVLDNCPSCDLFPALGNLPLLKYLSVQKLYGVREMRGLGKFPSLELLNLWEMYDLEVFEVKVGDFPCIHTLSINRCHKLKSVPCTPSLVHLSLHFCLRLPEFPELPSLEFLKIESFKKIEVLHLPTNLPVLKNLEIVDCGELRSLGNISQLKSIEKLKIIKCQKLDLNISWGRRHFKKESSRGICINLLSATSTVGGASFQLPSSTMLKVQKGDITVWSASVSNDAIVNAANERMLGGGGVHEVRSNLGNSSHKGSSPGRAHGGFLSLSRFSLSSQSSKTWPVNLSLNQITRMTHKFSSSFKIGEGYFGAVFKGELADGRFIAIKRARKQHFMSLSAEFRNEVALLTKIEHYNLVQLLGYIDQGNERIIISEYVPNGTLREHLDGLRGKTLDFAQRLEIAIDVAHGLTYLHLYAEKPIIHRDVKSSNILLTESFRAKVADFGFARTGPTEPDQSQIETDVKGTAGYLDPEYLKSNQLTLKSDVFSFGILLLEILSARRPVEVKRSVHERIAIRWAFDNYNNGRVAEIKDPMLQEEIDEGVLNKYLSLALQCAAPTRADRPVMKEVAEQLWKIRKEYTRSQRRAA